ncbi:efflux RND transporter periplasmic adaptor subunit [Rivihabitans pingtungensis]|jgi:RND family efflux transporter MFP subunit|uniref:efflux RND transporter periplasmic adaptor subunit n=1 Tax=Rivihabitans pingtungensis TaxID=1054498 RepID=UPI0023F2240A|nr:efflux RND transporter periplasmic adaptor subunit [Rivihabitans pingtungensis]HNX72055.1 efflux RND transporter periplasmic adaptor subunit [Rivihabitans pingtungensis]
MTIRHFAALCLVGALAACSKPEAQPEAPRPVRSVTLGASNGQTAAFHAGDIRARHEARLAFRVGGKVVARLVDVGATVKPGQALARLEDNDTSLDLASRRAKLAAAEADLKQNEADIKRYRELLAQHFISQAEFDRREAALAAARGNQQAALAAAQLGANQQGYTTLTAERAGVVTSIDAEVGQVVSAGQVVARVAESSEREAVIAVAESQLAEVRAARGFVVQVGQLPGQYQGVLRELAPDADSVSRTYTARITLKDADDSVRLGMSARVYPQGEAAAPLSVPLSAVLDENNRHYLWLLDGKAPQVKRVEVKLAKVSSDTAWIASGVRAGQEVVTAGVHLLRDGQTVRRLTHDPAQPVGTQAK